MTLMPPKPDLPIYGLLRQRYAEAYGRNLSRMATACEATPTMIKKWIAEDPRERTTPSPGSCRKIAKAFHLDADDVLAMAGWREADTTSVQLDPRLSAFLSEVEAGWRAMDETARDMAERTARALFHVEPVQRRRRVTDENGEFGRPKMERVQPAVPRRKYQSQSMATMISQFGLQPART